MLRTGLARATPTGPASSGGRSGRPGAVSGIGTAWRSTDIPAGHRLVVSPDRGRSPRCAATPAHGGCVPAGPRALDPPGGPENRCAPANRLGEITMVRPSLLAILRGSAVAVLLVTVGGCAGGAGNEVGVSDAA